MPLKQITTGLPRGQVEMIDRVAEQLGVSRAGVIRAHLDGRISLSAPAEGPPVQVTICLRPQHLAALGDADGGRGARLADVLSQGPERRTPAASQYQVGDRVSVVDGDRVAYSDTVRAVYPAYRGGLDVETDLGHVYTRRATASVASDWAGRWLFVHERGGRRRR